MSVTTLQKPPERNSTPARVARALETDPRALGELLAQSGYFKDARGAAQAAVKVLAGRELGLGPVASMSGIHIIEGKPVLGANLLAALVARDPHYRYDVLKLDDQACVLEFYRGRKKVGVSSFTLDDAKRAGVAGKQNWRQYPRNMLFARAISNGVTFYCPDLTAGAPVYTPDELGADDAVDTTTGEVVDAAPGPEVDGQPAALPPPERQEPPVVSRPTAREPQPTEELATVAQRRLMFARAKGMNIEEPQLRDLVRDVVPQSGGHTDRIPFARVDDVLAAIEAWEG